MESVHFSIFLERCTYVDVLLKVYVKMYMCKYCDIGTCDDDMYV